MPLASDSKKCRNSCVLICGRTKHQGRHLYVCASSTTSFSAAPSAHAVKKLISYFKISIYFMRLNAYPFKWGTLIYTYSSALVVRFCFFVIIFHVCKFFTWLPHELFNMCVRRRRRVRMWLTYITRYSSNNTTYILYECMCAAFASLLTSVWVASSLCGANMPAQRSVALDKCCRCN